jgi:type I restriction enzyme S subunit
VAALPVSAPPFAEQQHIVVEIERRRSVAEEVEADLTANLHRAQRLRQSILKQVFFGSLGGAGPGG